MSLGGKLPGVTPQMVSLFTSEEQELDRYAAAIAATEWLRKERDTVMKTKINPLAYYYLRATKGDQYTSWMTSHWVDDECRRAQHNYLLIAGRIITSCDLSIARYNQLSKIVAQDKRLADKVKRQAYLYRVGAELTGDKITAVDDPDLKEGARGVRSGLLAGTGGACDNEEGQGGGIGGGWLGKPKQIRVFARCLRQVELLRLEQRRKLMEQLETDVLPAGMCRPSMLRISGSPVRKACETFPMAAEQVVKKNGLRPEEFNKLLERCRSDLLYRYRVLRAVKSMGNIDR